MNRQGLLNHRKHLKKCHLYSVSSATNQVYPQRNWIYIVYDAQREFSTDLSITLELETGEKIENYISFVIFEKDCR